MRRRSGKDDPSNFLYEAKPWSYEYWNENLRMSNSYGSCLTDTSFIIENNSGMMVRLEVVSVSLAPKGEDGYRDTGENKVTLRYTGGESEFTYREEDLHRRIKKFV